MFSRSVETEAKVDAGGRPRGKMVYPMNGHPCFYLPPRQTQTGTLAFVPYHRPGFSAHSQAQTEVFPDSVSVIPRAPAHQATGFPSKLQLRSSGLNMAGKMVREALVETMGRPLPSVDTRS